MDIGLNVDDLTNAFEQAFNLFRCCVTGTASAHESFWSKTESFDDGDRIKVTVRKKETSFGESARHLC